MNESSDGLSHQEMGLPDKSKLEAKLTAKADTRLIEKDDGTTFEIEWNTFEISGGKVKVECRTLQPERSDSETEKKALFGEAILFLSGVGAEVDSDTVADLSQQLANYGQTPTLALTSRVEQVNSDDKEELLHQAEAIEKFVIQKGIKEVTLVGYSLGGSKAIDLAYLLQVKHPDTQIKGLILFGPAGLYEQNSRRIGARLAWESAVETPIAIGNLLLSKVAQTTFGKFNDRVFPRVNLWKFLRAGRDVATSYGTELLRSGPRGFGKRLKQEGVEAAQRNERAGKLTMPVVLLQGVQDSVYKADQFIPEGSDVRGLEAQKARSAALKEHVFSKSKSLIVLLVEKMGQHGFPYFRDTDVANSGLLMLQRELEREGREERANERKKK